MGFFKRRKPPLKSVLFVCSANITRSASAEALFRDAINKVDEHWKIGSAGVSAIQGANANRIVSLILHQRGISLMDHQSQLITPKLISNFYWILVMEQAHKEAILKMDPMLGGRIFTVREFGRATPPPELDMPDPTGKEPEDFRELFRILDEEIPRIIKILQAKISDLTMD